MSYDMMVFEASAAPREAAAFIAWFEKQTQWNERHEYDDPAVSSPALQAWFAEMARTSRRWTDHSATTMTIVTKLPSTASAAR